MSTTRFLILSAVLVFVPAAQALTITPDSGVDGVSRWTGSDPSQSEIDAYIATNFPYLDIMYKQDVPDEDGSLPADTGSLAASYSTVFENSSTDPMDAVITHVGGDYVSANPFLLVKDGNQDPAWYLFDLSAFSWNGTETLELRDFWPAQGAISHVSLYGSPTTVPDASTTVILIGIGLTVLGCLAGRKSLARE